MSPPETGNIGSIDRPHWSSHDAWEISCLRCIPPDDVVCRRWQVSWLTDHGQPVHAFPFPKGNSGSPAGERTGGIPHTVAGAAADWLPEQNCPARALQRSLLTRSRGAIINQGSHSIMREVRGTPNSSKRDAGLHGTKSLLMPIKLVAPIQ